MTTTSSNAAPLLVPFVLLIAVSRSAYADESFVLPLETPSGSGSITIIGDDSRGGYTFLTASHVISEIGKGEQSEVEIKLNGESTYVNADVIKDFSSEGIDLALGTFKLKRPSAEIRLLPIFALAPDNNPDDGNTYRDLSVPCNNEKILSKYGYDVCTSSKWSDSHLCDWYIDWGMIKAPCGMAPKRNIQVPVSFGTWSRKAAGAAEDGIIRPYRIIGYSMATRAINARILRSSTVRIEHKMNGNKDGYDYIYSVQSSVPGMSGGPLMAARKCPSYSWHENRTEYQGIVGIHGRSEEYGGSGGRSGMGLAIPLTNNVIADYLKSNSSQLGLLAGERYKRTILRYCEKDFIKYVL